MASQMATRGGAAGEEKRALPVSVLPSDVRSHAAALGVLPSDSEDDDEESTSTSTSTGGAAAVAGGGNGGDLRRGANTSTATARDRRDAPRVSAGAALATGPAAASALPSAPSPSAAAVAERAASPSHVTGTGGSHRGSSTGSHTASAAAAAASVQAAPPRRRTTATAPRPKPKGGGGSRKDDVEEDEEDEEEKELADDDVHDNDDDDEEEDEKEEDHDQVGEGDDAAEGDDEHDAYHNENGGDNDDDDDHDARSGHRKLKGKSYVSGGVAGAARGTGPHDSKAGVVNGGTGQASVCTAVPTGQGKSGSAVVRNGAAKKARSPSRKSSATAPRHATLTAIGRGSAAPKTLRERTSTSHQATAATAHREKSTPTSSMHDHMTAGAAAATLLGAAAAALTGQQQQHQMHAFQNNPKTGPLRPLPQYTQGHVGGGGAAIIGGCSCGRGCASGTGCLVVIERSGGSRHGRGGRSNCCDCNGNNSGCCWGRGERNNGCGGCGGGGGYGGYVGGCCGNNRGGSGGGRNHGGPCHPKCGCDEHRRRNDNCCRSPCCRITTYIIFGLIGIFGALLVLQPFRLHKMFAYTYATLPFGEAMSAHFIAGPYIAEFVGWALIVIALAAIDASAHIFRFVDCCCSGYYSRRRRVCGIESCGGCSVCGGGGDDGFGAGAAVTNGFGGGGKTFGFDHQANVGLRGANGNAFLPGGWWFGGRRVWVMDGPQWLYAFCVTGLSAVLFGLVQNNYIELSVPSIMYLDWVVLGGVLWYIYYRLLLTARERMNFQVIIVLTAVLVTVTMHIRYAIFLNYYTNTYQLAVAVGHFLVLWLSAFVLCWAWPVSRLLRTSLPEVRIGVVCE